MSRSRFRLPASVKAADLFAPFSIVLGKIPDDLRPWKDAIARKAPAGRNPAVLKRASRW